MNFPLEGSRVLITGGAGTIGISTAIKCAKKGANVIIVDINKDVIKTAIEHANKEGCKHIDNIVCDLSDFDKTKNLFNEAETKFGNIDILVNNAGVADTNNDTLIENVTEEQLDRVMNINFKAAFLLSKSAVASMAKRKFGRIINISSIAAFIGLVGHSNYSSSKGALLSMTRTIALEYATSGITANCIAPGAIDTGMTNVLPDKTRRHFEQIVPMGYMGTGNDIAEVITFLASKEARYITGQTIHVDGGLYIA